MEIIYQDQNLIAVVKPSGMIVHRGWGQDARTVSDMIRDQITGAQVHAVHRLDRGTSGVLLFALNPESARFMQEQMQGSGFSKTYLALVRGPMLEDCYVDNPVPKDKSKKGIRLDARTRFRVLSHKDRWSLVLAEPITGRLHQIRRHLKHLSHPIVGDVRYGKGEINRLFRLDYGLERMALHAARLEIRVPNSDRKLLLAAKLPADLLGPLNKLGIQIPGEFI